MNDNGKLDFGMIVELVPDDIKEAALKAMSDCAPKAGKCVI